MTMCIGRLYGKGDLARSLSLEIYIGSSVASLSDNKSNIVYIDY